jgi:hypothetical protein
MVLNQETRHHRTGDGAEQTLLPLPGVSDLRSNIAIRTFKEAGPLPLRE